MLDISNTALPSARKAAAVPSPINSGYSERMNATKPRAACLTRRVFTDMIASIRKCVRGTQSNQTSIM